MFAVPVWLYTQIRIGHVRWCHHPARKHITHSVRYKRRPGWCRKWCERSRRCVWKVTLRLCAPTCLAYIIQKADKSTKAWKYQNWDVGILLCWFARVRLSLFSCSLCKSGYLAPVHPIYLLNSLKQSIPKTDQTDQRQIKDRQDRPDRPNRPKTEKTDQRQKRQIKDKTDNTD
jgi:hypothetical protein